MTKSHPAKKARTTAGFLGAAGFLAVSVGVLDDATVQIDLSPLVANELSSYTSLTDSESDFTLDGSAQPVNPDSTTSEPKSPRDSVEVAPTTTKSKAS